MSKCGGQDYLQEQYTYEHILSSGSFSQYSECGQYMRKRSDRFTRKLNWIDTWGIRYSWLLLILNLTFQDKVISVTPIFRSRIRTIKISKALNASRSDPSLLVIPLDSNMWWWTVLQERTANCRKHRLPSRDRILLHSKITTVDIQQSENRVDFSRETVHSWQPPLVGLLLSKSDA